MSSVPPQFTAVSKFTRYHVAWGGYVAGMNLEHLEEVVTLDMLLCPYPSEFEPITDEDWAHCICGKFRTGQFDDLAYLLRRVAGISGLNILGLYEEPTVHDSEPPAEGFSFIGYELMSDGISSVTNCGEWEGIFCGGDLNRYGLLPDFETATKVRRLMLEKFPDEPHAKCVLYSVWRLDQPGMPPLKTPN